MEDIEELLRRKAIESMSSAAANPNSNNNDNIKNNPSQPREEGELSSSTSGDDNEIPSDSAGQSAGAASQQAVESNVDPVNKQSQGSKMGKCVSGNDPTSYGGVQLRTSLNSVPSKPVGHHTPGWYIPSVANRNLVISFSDDDSESDSEECNTQRVSERKGNKFDIDESKRTGSTQLESEYQQRTASSQIKRVPEKFSVSRTGISSMGKIHGSNSRSTGPPLIEQGSNQCLNPNNSKLERLRQQIAIRENELRLQLKSMQQIKKTNSGFHQNCNALNEKNVAVKKSRSPSVETKSMEHDEPEKKRMRPNESCQRNVSFDRQQRVLEPATKSVSKSKMAVVGKINGKNQCTNGVPIGKLDKNARKPHEKVESKISVLPGNLVAKYSESSVPLVEATSSNMKMLKLPIKQRIHNGLGADIPASRSQTDKSTTTRLMDPSNMLSQSSWPMQVTSTADVETAHQLKMPCSKEPNIESLKLSGTFGGHHSTSSTDKSTDPQNECSEVLPDDGILNPSANDMVFKYSAYVPESKFGTSDLNLLGHNCIDIQSLMILEDTQDRELEEAQEQRRRCEQEERKALKAYREAQRALIEANARCTYLYKRRELFSAKLRAFMMEDSSALWSSRWQKHTEAELNSLDNVHCGAVNPVSSLGHQMQAEIEVLNQLGSGSHIRGTDSLVLHTSYQHIEGQKVISEPCNERDASILDLSNSKENGVVDGVYTPSNHTNMSADEDDDMLLLDHRTAQSKFLSEDEEDFGKRELTTCHKPEALSSTAGAQDCALLEASLRSKLFARLGTKSMTKSCNLNTGEVVTSNKCSDHQMEEVKSHTSKGDEPYEVNGQNKPSDIEEACCSAANASFIPSSAVKIAIGLITPTSCSGCKTQVPRKNEISHEEDTTLGCSDFFGFLGEQLVISSESGNQGGMGSYTCDLSIDPFWPVCMFELRGKCNDEECQWQHVKDYSERNIKHLHAANADSDAGSLSYPEKFSSALKLSNYHWVHIISASPTYLVGLDLLKPELHTSRSVFARTVGLCLRKGFSTFSGIPFSVQKNILQDVPFFHDSDGRFWGHGSWTRQSSYFPSQDVAMKQREHGSADPEQILEVALVLINEEFNKFEGKKKVLSMLSRALEDDPTSVPLWIFYLYIYYCNEKAIGKDDMFLHAIRNNEDSYELWLMYINSRVQIADRLLAYDSALSALCRHACTTDWDKVYGSACILDLFLQMMDFLFMSGNSGKAIQRICRLFSAATDVSEHGSVSLSDILVYLTVSDKCIFWVCCVYLIIYRKLPEKYVEQFEFEKELPFGIEWPSAQLTALEKNRALKLMKMGVDSVTLGLNACEAPRIAHLLAVNHFQCVAVLEGIECSKNLLDKYIMQYPTCIELVLISARLHVNCNGVLGFQRFEDALSNWPSETPGIQCIWNQYVQCALEVGDTNLAKELMVQWFQSVWKVNRPQSGKLSDRDDNGLHDQLESCSFSKEVPCIASNPRDELFGLLNLSLHRLLQRDQIEARLAIDKALKIAAPEDLKHCVKEHATFVLSHLSEPTEDAPGSGMLNLLHAYLVDGWSLRVTEPLSRRFCQNIRRPRIRHLINKILGPTSSDFSLINSVFEACYGPSLLPGSFSEVKNLVDFVEPLMELFPANYRLAMSVCNFLTSKSSSDSVAYASVIFWASSHLVNSIYQAFPVAPEHAWVEVAGILSKLVEVSSQKKSKLVEIQGVSERFHQQALLVYPFSIKLWNSYYNLAKKTGNLTMVIKTARERGIELD